MLSHLIWFLLDTFVVVLALLWFQPRFVLNLITRFGPSVYFYKPGAGRQIALTIDDAPSSEWTPKILALLEQYEARATFFIMSDELKGNEELVAQVVGAGHELGNHTRRDHSSIKMSPEDFEEELHIAQEAIAAYSTPRWFRPGMGWYNERIVRSAATLGCRTALGDVFPYDPHIHSPRVTAAHVCMNVQPGSIVILHDSAKYGARTVECLKRVLPVLREKGYTIGTLSELFCEEEVL